MALDRQEAIIAGGAIILMIYLINKKKEDEPVITETLPSGKPAPADELVTKYKKSDDDFLTGKLDAVFTKLVEIRDAMVKITTQFDYEKAKHDGRLPQSPPIEKLTQGVATRLQACVEEADQLFGDIPNRFAPHYVPRFRSLQKWIEQHLDAILELGEDPAPVVYNTQNISNSQQMLGGPVTNKVINFTNQTFRADWEGDVEMDKFIGPQDDDLDDFVVSKRKVPPGVPVSTPGAFVQGKPGFAAQQDTDFAKRLNKAGANSVQSSGYGPASASDRVDDGSAGVFEYRAPAGGLKRGGGGEEEDADDPIGSKFVQATGRVGGKQTQQPAPDVAPTETISNTAVLGGVAGSRPNFVQGKEQSQDKAKAARVAELETRGEGDTEESQYIRRDISDREGVLDRSNALPDDTAKFRQRVDAAVALFDKRVNARPIGTIMREVATQAWSALWNLSPEGWPERSFRNIKNKRDTYVQVVGFPTKAEVRKRKDYQYWRDALNAAYPAWTKFSKLRTADEAGLPPLQPSAKRRESVADVVGAQMSPAVQLANNPPMAMRPQITQQPVSGIPGAFASARREREADIMGD